MSDTRKLSEIRPCDNCGGKIAPVFYVVRTTIAAFDLHATNAVLGLNTIYGGRALGLAEALAPGEPVKIADDPELTTELFICLQCYCAKVCIGQLVESRNAAIEAAKEGE